MAEDNVEVVVRSPDEPNHPPQEFIPNQPHQQQVLVQPPIMPSSPPPQMAISEYKPRENKRYQTAKKSREFTEGLKNENTYLQSKLKHMEYELYKKELETVETEKKLLKLRENYVEDYIKKAKELGDDEAEVEGQSVLTEIKIEKAMAENRGGPIPPTPDIVAAPKEEDDRIKNFRKYQEKTPWLDPKSELYDETLKNRYLHLAGVLDSIIKTNYDNPEEVIGSEEYYDALDYSIKSERSLTPQQPVQQTAPPIASAPMYNYGAYMGNYANGYPNNYNQQQTANGYNPMNNYNPSQQAPGLYPQQTPQQPTYFQSPQANQPIQSQNAPRYYAGNHRYK